jgi:RHS repeat-associated protein
LIYGPCGLPVEQINNTTGTISYLHHDQAGSTRLITGSTGTVTGKCSYSAYGTPTCEGTTTTPLGYDGQYTSTDTGLIYMRARVYDPATAQFLSRDPLASLTREPYAYAVDNPANLGDPTGYEVISFPIGGAGEAAGGAAVCGDPLTAAICAGAAGYGAYKAGEALINAIAGSEGSNEGEAELKEQETARENCGEISPNFNNPEESPGEGWEWRGNGPPGSNKGAWVNPETDETLHPDLGHGEPVGPHFDYTAPDGSKFRIYPDGRIEPNP